MLFSRADRPEKIRVGYALLGSLHSQPDVALFDLRFCLVPQPIIKVAVYLVGSPSEFIPGHSQQQLFAPVIFLESVREAFRQRFSAGFYEMDQFECVHRVPPDGNVFRGAGCMYRKPALAKLRLHRVLLNREAFPVQVAIVHLLETATSKRTMRNHNIFKNRPSSGWGEPLEQRSLLLPNQ